MLLSTVPARPVPDWQRRRLLASLDVANLTGLGEPNAQVCCHLLTCFSFQGACHALSLLLSDYHEMASHDDETRLFQPISTP